MTSRTFFAHAVRHVLTTGVAAVLVTAGGMPALAQQQSGGAVAMEEVLVTGSRIKGVTNEESSSPITVVTAEEIALTKASNLEDILNNMLGVGAGSTLASNNGGGGASNVNLRNLGASRSLVLIDGQRLIPVFGVTTALVDLNAIPISMVERVEVLRDGASSVYGADAIGGVINIITKKHFDGISFDAGYGQSGKNDTKTKNLSASIGVNSDKGNVMVAIGWDHLDPLQQFDRRWAEDPHIGGTRTNEGGSTYRTQLNTLQDLGSGTIWVAGVPYNFHDPATAGLLPHTVFLPKRGQLKLNAGAPGWNYLVQGLDRKQISLNAHYEVAPNVRFVMEGFYSDRTSEASLRPEPLLGADISTNSTTTGKPVFAGFYVPDYAPGNTLGMTFPAYLTPEQFGPRRYDDNSKTSRVRLGFEGAFGASSWNWEAGFVDQHNTTRNVTHHEGNFNRLAQLSGQINCIDVPGGCRSANAAELASSNAAVAAGIQATQVTAVPIAPPNWFNGPNMFSSDQVKYLTFDNTDVNTTEERFSYANINGSLFNLPAGPLRAAFGVEHRNEEAGDNPDQLVQSAFAPNASAPTHGGYNVSSVYGELQIPVLKNAPFAKSLNLSPSARYDKYDTFGDARTWKMGVEWAPVDDIRMRGSYATGFRAPSTSELFAGNGISDISASGDPCDSRAIGFNGNNNAGLGPLTPGSTCAAALTALGFNPATFQSPTNNQVANQLQVLQGGNPKLSPEKSKQYGLGVVLTPRFTPGLSLAADYYHIRIDNTVLTGGIAIATSVDAVLLGCYGPAATGGQSQAACNLIQRNRVTGAITQINSLNANFGTARVSGIDYDLVYDTARAHLNLPFPGNLVFELQMEEQYVNTQTNADGTTTNFLGFFQYASESITPHWKALGRLEYQVGPWTAQWQTRYLEAMTNLPSEGAPRVYGSQVGNVYYHSLSGSYSIKNAGPFKSARFVLGVNNLTDKDPPFLRADSICKCNSLAGPYDPVGRYFFARMSSQF